MITRTLLKSLILILVTPASFAGGLEAWWLTSKFSATSTHTLPLTAEQIDSSWSSYNLLSWNQMPAEAKADFGWMRKENLAFDAKGDFNKNGLPDQAFVGIYATNDRNTGRFFLVTERAANTLKVLYLHKEQGEPGFGIIAHKSSSIYWSPCMQCGEFRKLTYLKDRLTLD